MELRKWSISIVIVFFSASGKSFGYTAVDFFNAVNPAEIESQEQMTPEAKASLQSQKLKPNLNSCENEEDRYTWYVSKQSNVRLELMQCGIDESVFIHVFRLRSGGYLVANVSVTGNHGSNQRFKFYSIGRDGAIKGMLTAAEVGIEPVYDNEFLSSDQKFSEGSDTVSVWITDDGAISTYPWDFLSPRWRGKNIVYSIKFIWDGVQFRKEVTR